MKRLSIVLSSCPVCLLDVSSVIVTNVNTDWGDGWEKSSLTEDPGVFASVGLWVVIRKIRSQDIYSFTTEWKYFMMIIIPDVSHVLTVSWKCLYSKPEENSGVLHHFFVRSPFDSEPFDFTEQTPGCRVFVVTTRTLNCENLTPRLKTRDMERPKTVLLFRPFQSFL